MRRDDTGQPFTKLNKKEKEAYQNRALARFEEGAMLRDLQEDSIFKFKAERDSYLVVTAPHRFVEHKAEKPRIRFGRR